MSAKVLLSAVVLVAACASPAQQLAATPRRELAVKELPLHIQFGEPILRLSGGGLGDRSVDVPMWLDLVDAAETQGSCEVT